MTEQPSPIQPPTQAGPAGRTFHGLLTLGGWLLFIYWWWLVFHRVSRAEIRFTLVFVALSLVIIVGFTALWAWHNMGIYKRRGPRTAVREVTPDFSHDRVGRPVTITGEGMDRRSAPVVIVRITDEGKSFEPAPSLPPGVTPGGGAKQPRAGGAP